MPKSGIYDDMIQVPCLEELREKLTALGYLQGKRDLSDMARNLITSAVDAQIAGMDQTTRRQYESILISVHATTVIRRQKRQERLMKLRSRST